MLIAGPARFDCSPLHIGQGWTRRRRCAWLLDAGEGIGAVWPNKSGKGFNLTWDSLPLGDGLTMMLPFDKERGESTPPEV